MQHRAVSIIWAAGLGVAVLVYLVGPDDFLAAAFAFADHLAGGLRDLVLRLGGRAYDLLRAFAIACFVVFFGLSIVANGRGLPSRGLLLVVTLLFVVLVWHEGPEATGHWLLAFLLAAAAAASMTRRLMEAPPRMVNEARQKMF